MSEMESSCLCVVGIDEVEKDIEYRGWVGEGGRERRMDESERNDMKWME
jgi:hypothetical protein